MSDSFGCGVIDRNIGNFSDESPFVVVDDDLEVELVVFVVAIDVDVAIVVVTVVVAVDDTTTVVVLPFVTSVVDVFALKKQKQ